MMSVTKMPRKKKRGMSAANVAPSPLTSRPGNENQIDVISLQDELRQVRSDLNDRVEACKLLKASNNRLKEECRAFEKRIEGTGSGNGSAPPSAMKMQVFSVGGGGMSMAPPVVRALKKSVRSLTDKLKKAERIGIEQESLVEEFALKLEEAQSKLSLQDQELRSVRKELQESNDLMQEKGRESLEWDKERTMLLEELREAREAREWEKEEGKKKLEDKMKRMQIAPISGNVSVHGNMRCWTTMIVSLGRHTETGQDESDTEKHSIQMRKSGPRRDANDSLASNSEHSLSLSCSEPVLDSDAEQWELATNHILFGNGTRVNCELRIMQGTIRVNMQDHSTNSSGDTRSVYSFITIQFGRNGRDGNNGEVDSLSTSDRLQSTACIELGTGSAGPTEYCSRFIFDVPMNTQIVKLINGNGNRSGSPNYGGLIRLTMFSCTEPLGIFVEMTNSGTRRNIIVHAFNYPKSGKGLGINSDHICLLLFTNNSIQQSSQARQINKNGGQVGTFRHLHFVGMLNTFISDNHYKLKQGEFAVDVRALALKGNRLHASLSSGIFIDTGKTLDQKIGVKGREEGLQHQLSIWRINESESINENEKFISARSLGASDIDMRSLLDDDMQSKKRMRELHLKADTDEGSDHSGTTAIVCYSLHSYPSLVPLSECYTNLSHVANHPLALQAVSGDEFLGVLVARQTERMRKALEDCRKRIIYWMRQKSTSSKAGSREGDGDGLQVIMNAMMSSLNDIASKTYHSIWSKANRIDNKQESSSSKYWQEFKTFSEHILSMVKAMKNHFQALIENILEDVRDISDPNSLFDDSICQHYNSKQETESGVTSESNLFKGSEMIEKLKKEATFLMHKLVLSVESCLFCIEGIRETNSKRNFHEVQSPSSETKSTAGLATESAGAGENLSTLRHPLSGVFKQLKDFFAIVIREKMRVLSGTNHVTAASSDSNPSFPIKQHDDHDANDVGYIDAKLLQLSTLVSSVLEMHMPMLVEFLSRLMASTLHQPSEDTIDTGAPPSRSQQYHDVYNLSILKFFFNWLSTERHSIETFLHADVIGSSQSIKIVSSSSGLLQIFVKLTDWFLLVEDLVEDAFFSALRRMKSRTPSPKLYIGVENCIDAMISRSVHDMESTSFLVSSVVKGLIKGHLPRSSEEAVNLIMCYKRMLKRLLKRMKRVAKVGIRTISGMGSDGDIIASKGLAIIAPVEKKDHANIKGIVKSLTSLNVQTKVYYYDYSSKTWSGMGQRVDELQEIKSSSSSFVLFDAHADHHSASESMNTFDGSEIADEFASAADFGTIPAQSLCKDISSLGLDYIDTKLLSKDKKDELLSKCNTIIEKMIVHNLQNQDSKVIESGEGSTERYDYDRIAFAVRASFSRLLATANKAFSLESMTNDPDKANEEDRRTSEYNDERSVTDLLSGVASAQERANGLDLDEFLETFDTLEASSAKCLEEFAATAKILEGTLLNTIEAVCSLKKKWTLQANVVEKEESAGDNFKKIERPIMRDVQTNTDGDQYHPSTSRFCNAIGIGSRSPKPKNEDALRITNSFPQFPTTHQTEIKRDLLVDSKSFGSTMSSVPAPVQSYDASNVASTSHDESYLLRKAHQEYQELLQEQRAREREMVEEYRRKKRLYKDDYTASSFSHDSSTDLRPSTTSPVIPNTAYESDQEMKDHPESHNVSSGSMDESKKETKESGNGISVFINPIADEDDRIEGQTSSQRNGPVPLIPPFSPSHSHVAMNQQSSGERKVEESTYTGDLSPEDAVSKESVSNVKNETKSPEKNSFTFDESVSKIESQQSKSSGVPILQSSQEPKPSLTKADGKPSPSPPPTIDSETSNAVADDETSSEKTHSEQGQKNKEFPEEMSLEVKVPKEEEEAEEEEDAEPEPWYARFKQALVKDDDEEEARTQNVQPTKKKLEKTTKSLTRSMPSNRKASLTSGGSGRRLSLSFWKTDKQKEKHLNHRSTTVNSTKIDSTSQELDNDGEVLVNTVVFSDAMANFPW